MRKYSFYKQIYEEFEKLCVNGLQSCSFSAYCKERGVDYHKVRDVMKGVGYSVSSIPGYVHFRTKPSKETRQLCSRVYEDFKHLCAEGKQPGSFTSYCEGFGISRDQMHNFQRKNNLQVMGLPGYVYRNTPQRYKGMEVSFEDVIFEDAGFLPTDSRTITINVDDNVRVNFPADTDVSIIATFVRRVRKGVGNVGA